MTQKEKKSRYVQTHLYNDYPEAERRQAAIDCLLDYRVTKLLVHPKDECPMTFLCSGKFKKTPLGLRIDFDVLSGKTGDNKFHIDLPDIQDKHFYLLKPSIAPSSFYIRSDEITRLNFECDPELEADTDGYCRVVKEGAMEIKLLSETEDDKKRRKEIFDFFAPELGKAYPCPIDAFDIDQGLPDHEFLGLPDLSDEEDDEPCTGFAYRKKDGSLYIINGKSIDEI